MAIKVKEIKEDAVIDVKVNKNYYMMLKHTLFYLFNQIPDNKEREASLSKISDGDYANMDAYQRSFYTVTLMIAEIEKLAKEQNLFDEKDVLEPGDEGYVEPTE
jgi:CRISPR/Cas system-associated endoribonuclease Cas2